MYKRRWGGGHLAKLKANGEREKILGDKKESKELARGIQI